MILRISTYVLLFVFLFLSSVIALGQDAATRDIKKTLIKGELKNMPNPVPYIYFIYRGGSNSTDSVPVINNKYEYTINSIYSPNYVTINSSPTLSMNPGDIAVLLLDGKTVHITSVDSFSNVTVTGSKAYIEFVKLNKLFNPYKTTFNTLQKLQNAAQNEDELNAVKVKRNAVKTELGLKYLNYIKSNPQSPALMYALACAADYLTEENYAAIKTIFEQQSEENKKSWDATRIKRKIYDNTPRIGDMAVNFTLYDSTGSPVSLETYKGKYVLLDFWASWCVPCREENRYLVKAYNKYKDKNFTILSVSADIEKTLWVNAIIKDGLEWGQVIDEHATAQKLYKISLFPSNFLIDPEGKIIDRNIKGERVEIALSEIVGKQN